MAANVLFKVAKLAKIPAKQPPGNAAKLSSFFFWLFLALTDLQMHTARQNGRNSQRMICVVVVVVDARPCANSSFGLSSRRCLFYKY